MKLSTLNQTHETYSLDLIKKYQALYEGGQCFRSCIQRFLFRNPVESTENYQLRVREAHYESHVNTIVNQFASQLFSCPFIVRSDSEEIDEFYSEFKEDCDLNGRDLLTFVQHLFTTSLIHGKAWVLLNLPSDQNSPPENLLEYQERGLGRVWLTDIEPDEVLDWEIDEFGQFIWVITHTKEIKRLNPRSDSKTVVETWKLYDSENVETFQISYEKGKTLKKDEIIPSISKEKHGFPRVPLLKICLPEGLWLINRLADAQIEHFRMSNALAFTQRAACNPMLVYKAETDDVKQSAGFGIKIGKEEDLKWISPSTESFQVIQNTISSLKDEIYRLAQQMALAVDNSAGAIKRSGESKAKDTESTKIILYSYAEVVKGFVEEIYELVSDARGDTSVTFSIEGMDTFQIDDPQGVIEAAKLAKDFPILSETFNRELQFKVATSILPNLSQDIKDQIKKEISEADLEESQTSNEEVRSNQPITSSEQEIVPTPQPGKNDNMPGKE